MKNRPKIGIGVILIRRDGKILIGKRKGSHAPYYSIPGGHLELGETFEQAAIRELKEELDISIKKPQVIAVTNNLETYRKEKLHTISIILKAKKFSGEIKNMEPDKCKELLWCDPKKLPRPHFDASRIGVGCYLKNKFYT